MIGYLTSKPQQRGLGSFDEEDPWAVIGSHPRTAFLVVNDDLHRHRINQVSH